MRKFLLPALLILAVSSCKESYRKGTNGLEYKIMSSSSGEKLKLGEYMQIHVAQYYQNGRKDSLLSDTRSGRGPLIEQVDSMSTPPQYIGILTQLRKGDSLAMRILTDSVYAKNSMMPPMFKKGHYLYTTVRVLNIFKTRAEADSAQKAEMAIQVKQDSIKQLDKIKQDDALLREYFTKNKVDVSKLLKAPRGTYVEILQAGNDQKIDTSVIVKAYYTGRKMDGTIFDSNQDPTFNHLDPFYVNMSGNGDYRVGYDVMPGWVEGMLLLSKGAKARFYIPSPLAYGEQGDPRIGPNAILIFDIEVADLLNKTQAMAEMKALNDKLALRQKKMIDSLKKVRTDSIERTKAKPVESPTGKK